MMETVLSTAISDGQQCWKDSPVSIGYLATFDTSLMVYFRKRLTPEVLGEINEIIVRDVKACQGKESKDDDSGEDSGTGGNSGIRIVDAHHAKISNLPL